MSTLTASDRLTALEAKHRDGMTAEERRIIEQLTVTNEILLDAPVWEANEKTYERGVRRTALPHGEHRTYYKGVSQGASQTEPYSDVVCQLAQYSQVDKSLVDQKTNKQEFQKSNTLTLLA